MVEAYKIISSVERVNGVLQFTVGNTASGATWGNEEVKS